MSSMPEWGELSPAQRRFVGAALEQNKAQLGGVAGSGKSTCLAHVARRWNVEKRGELVFASPTHRAKRVLQDKLAALGMPEVPVRTLHSLTMAPVIKIEKRLVADPRTGRRKEVEVEVVTGFKPKEAPVEATVIVDEASMIGKAMFDRIRHLLPRHRLVGDPNQLPPVRDEPMFGTRLAVNLGQPMRASLESAVTRFALTVLDGKPDYSIVPVRSRREALLHYKSAREQGLDPMVICHANQMRMALTRGIRERVLGLPALPQPGEVLLGYRTGNEIINGTPYTVRSVGRHRHGDELLPLELIGPDDELLEVAALAAPLARYEWQRPDAVIPRGAVVLDHGVALTCHKAQGSEAEAVIVLDDSDVMGPDLARRWLYTAVTRARTHLLLLLDRKPVAASKPPPPPIRHVAA